MNRKELNAEASLQAAFGAHLRTLRERRDWTQEDLAHHLACSSQHVSAVETARKPPTLPFARRADRVFGTTTKGDSFERKWRDMRHGILLEGFPEYVGYESRAVEIRLFQIGVVPGLLQTEAYARALAGSHVRRGSISKEHAAERVAFLMERQKLLTRDQPPTLLVVLDESCTRRLVGGNEVMDDQVRKLVEFAELSNTMLQVATFGMGELRPFDLPVNLLTLADRSMISYAESHAQGTVDRESTSVLSLLKDYHQLQAESLSQSDSVALIEQLRKGTS